MGTGAKIKLAPSTPSADQVRHCLSFPHHKHRKNQRKPYLEMVEHSMCQPGLPFPQGEAQNTSWGLAAFQRAKSLACRLSESPANNKWWVNGRESRLNKLTQNHHKTEMQEALPKDSVPSLSNLTFIIYMFFSFPT